METSRIAPQGQNEPVYIPVVIDLWNPTAAPRSPTMTQTVTEAVSFLFHAEASVSC